MGDRTVVSDTGVYNTSQGYERVLTVRQDGHTLRATAYRDFYDQQSRFSVQRWNGERWHGVVGRAGGVTSEGMPYATAAAHVREVALDKVIEEMLLEALAVIG